MKKYILRRRRRTLPNNILRLLGSLLAVLFCASCGGPIIITFTVQPTEIQSGDIVYFSISVVNPDNYHGGDIFVEVNRNYKDQWGSSVVAGFTVLPGYTYNTVRDYPTRSTTYTLKATNDGGSVVSLGHTVTVK